MRTGFIRAGFACVFVLSLAPAAIGDEVTHDSVRGTAGFAVKGTPLSAIPVKLERESGDVIANGRTDGVGTVTFRALAPGKYVLVLGSKNGFVVPTDRDGPVSTSIRVDVRFEDVKTKAVLDRFSILTCPCGTGRPVAIHDATSRGPVNQIVTLTQL